MVPSTLSKNNSDIADIIFRNLFFSKIFGLMDNQANCPIVIRANRPSIDPVYFGLTDFRGKEFSDFLASGLFLLQII
jgi:hypothetical protein